MSPLAFTLKLLLDIKNSLFSAPPLIKKLEPVIQRVKFNVSDYSRLRPKNMLIYADPPWQYKRNGNHSAESQYNVMSLENIKNLPVNKISEDNSHLYMWVTNPFISEGLEVCKSWGFDYKTFITWVKTYKDGSPIMRMGY